MIGGGTFPLSVFNMVLISAGGVVSIGLCVLLWVWVAETSGVDVTNMLMEALEVTGVFLTSTNHESQSAALLWGPDIHSKVMLWVASSSDHLFTFLFTFLLFKTFCRGLWSLHTTRSDHSR